MKMQPGQALANFIFLQLRSAVVYNEAITGFISNIEDTYHITSVVFIIPDITSLDFLNLTAIKSPVLFPVTGGVRNFKNYPIKNPLFITAMKNNSILASDYIDSHATDMEKRGKVLVFALDEESSVDGIFEWFWKRKVLQVVVAKLSANELTDVYAYSPFPEMNIFKVTDCKRPYRSDPLDLKGYPIRSVIYEDPPRVYKYQNRWGEEVISGYGGRLFSAFLKKHNGTFVQTYVENITDINEWSSQELLVEEKIDIGVNPYPRLFTELVGSYPVNFLRVCVIVPAGREINPSLYNILPFDNLVWYFLLGFILYFFMIDVCVASTLLHRVNYTEAILTAAKIIIGLSPNMQVYTMKWQTRTMFVFFAIFGVVMTSLYQSMLASFYTTKVYGNAIESLDDAQKVNLTILAREDEWFLLKLFIDYRYHKSFRPVSAEVIAKTRENLNPAFGYITSEDIALFILERQKHFSRPLFTKPKIFIKVVRMQFLMPGLTPYEGAFSRVIFQTQEAGLFEKWQKDTFEECVALGLVNRISDPSVKYKPLVLANFEYYWIFWCCGIGLSCICFVLELHMRYFLQWKDKAWRYLRSIRFFRSKLLSNQFEL